MLRKTADGKYERQDSNGVWQPVSEEEARAATQGGVSNEPQVEEGGVATMIDTLVDELHGDANGAHEDLRDYAKIEDQERAEARASREAEQAVEVQAAQGLLPDNLNPTLGEVDTEPAKGDFDLEVPGLVSTDKGRSQKGFQTVKERLKANARKRREPRRVEVGTAAAKVQGPAAREGTERRQQRRAQDRMEAGKSSTVAEGGLKQRYVNRPAPELLSSRPKWVQDLFEAHFRSEHTLGMRRAFNRMKISRQDYAIGWLTALDKFREEPSLLRSKERNGSAD